MIAPAPPAAAPRTALVAGASGLVGGHLLRLLLEEPAYGRVVALGRRPLEVAHAKLEPRVVDFARLEGAGLGPEADAFCCLGTTMKQAGSREAFRAVDHDAVLAFARAARGARRFLVVTAVDASPRSRVFYNRVKGEVEEALRALGFPALHLLRPSLLLGERRQARGGERAGEVALALARPFLLGPLRRYRAIEGATVARAMLRWALSDEAGARVHESDEIERIGGTR